MSTMIPSKIAQLCYEYRIKFGKKPKSFNYYDYNSFEEYEKYIKTELDV